MKKDNDYIKVVFEGEKIVKIDNYISTKKERSNLDFLKATFYIDKAKIEYYKNPATPNFKDLFTLDSTKKRGIKFIENLPNNLTVSDLETIYKNNIENEQINKYTEEQTYRKTLKNYVEYLINKFHVNNVDVLAMKMQKEYEANNKQ